VSGASRHARKVPAATKCRSAPLNARSRYFSSLALAIPASAQSVRIGDGPGGAPDVRLRIGPDHPHYRAHAERCRTVVTKITRPNGTVVTKRERKCRD
jgi:hypothetical protein